MNRIRSRFRSSTPSTGLLPPISMRKNLVWVVSSNIVLGVYQWLLVVLLAKMSGPESVGMYSFALALVLPVQTFLNLQLRGLQASDADDEYHFSDYLGLRTITSIIGVLVLGVMAFTVVDGAMSLVVLGIATIKLIESYAEVFYGAFQKVERLDFSSIARIISSFASILVFVPVFASTNSLWFALVAAAVAQLGTLVGYTMPLLAKMFRLQGQSFSWDHIAGKFERSRELATIALPLGVVMSVISVNDAMPRWFLAAYWSNFEIGIFAGFMQIVAIGIVVTSAIGQVLTPKFARWHRTNDQRRFFRVQNVLVAGSLAAGILAAILSVYLGDWLLTILYTSDYAGFSRALAIVALAAGCLYAGSFQGFGMTAARITRQQLYIYVPGMLLLGLALWILVPRYSIEGAASAMLISSIFQVGVGRWILWSRWDSHNSLGDTNIE